MSVERTIRLCPATSLLVGAALLLHGVAAAAQKPADKRPAADLATLDLEQLMQVEVVVGASKRAQNTRDVPSFVSVVTAADIREYGYRSLADVLKTLPSFYVSYDRNYAVAGVRGFSRPGDYSSRVLLLLNGLRTNDNLYDQAAIGQEFIVDMDVVERIEVIRGPSAAIYGSNAFFAVVNVVTKQGRKLDGGEATVSAASYDTYAGRASYGKALANGTDYVLSVSGSGSKGQRLFYPEFNDPATNNGFADAADDEHTRKVFGSVIKGSFTLEASNSRREKGVPTGAFGTIFNDTRTRTVDGLTLASLTYNHSFVEGTSLSTRVHAGRWTYRGDYAYAPVVLPNRDDDVGEWWGADVDAQHAYARHFLTVGGELRNNNKQNQLNFDPEPFSVKTDLRESSLQWGVFGQDEIKLLDALTLYTGVRYDHSQIFGSAVSPRLGLIFIPDEATTVKLLAGRAFRAPNEFELYYDTDLYEPNPRLQPERIETLELVAQRLFGGVVQVTGAAFRNTLSSLINQHVDATLGDKLQFINSGEIRSNGAEVGIEMNRGRGVTGQLTHSLQRSTDRSTGEELTNSPRHMTKLNLRIPVRGRALTAGVDAQHVSAVKTVGSNTAASYVITNLSLLAPSVRGPFALSATVYNLFDVRYGHPGSDEHIQDVIPQDRRNFRVKTILRF